jgi:glutathione S-transferase
MMILYAMPTSGNSYKVAWLLNILNKPYKLVPISSIDGTTRRPDFLAKNPNGQVPLLELEDGRRLAESNAIMLYLAEQAASSTESAATLLPHDVYERGLMYQWLFFEQYSHEPTIAVRRGNLIYKKRQASDEEMQQLLDKGYRALGVMETQLINTPFMAGDKMTIADIALFAYTHIASEGGYDMDRYPNIQDWIKKVRQSPGFCGMDILEGK